MNIKLLTEPLKQAKGQSIVEFAFILPVLVVLLFGLTDLCLMLYVNITMQNAVRQGARSSVVGTSSGGPTLRATLLQTIKDNSVGLYDKNVHSSPQLKTYILTPGNPTPFANNTSANTPVGTSGQIVMVQLDYTWPLLTPVLKPFFPKGQYNFTVKATMRNEPF